MKRKIFYIPGFDPRSEIYYKKFLLSEFPEVKPLIVQQSSNEICFQRAGMQVDYEILSWHKVVRRYWSKGVRESVRDIVNLFSEFVLKGTWRRLFSLSRRDGLQKAFSVYMLILSLLISLGSLGLLSSQIGLGSGFHLSLVMLLWFVVNFGIYLGLKSLNLFWVTRIKNFFVQYARQQTPDVKKFEKRALDKVLTCLESNYYDEVVLVAHSVGTILCLDMLAGCNDPRLKKLKVVTLGHCVTGVSILQPAGWFNERLKKLKKRAFLWIDVTSGKDAVNFYKVSPAYDQTIQPNFLLSAGFHEIFSSKRYTSLKWRFYDIHFLYLCHPDFPNNSLFNFSRLLFDQNLFSRVFRTSDGES